MVNAGELMVHPTRLTGLHVKLYADKLVHEGSTGMATVMLNDGSYQLRIMATHG